MASMIIENFLFAGYGNRNSHYPEKPLERQPYNISDQNFDLPNHLDDEPKYFPPSSEIYFRKGAQGLAYYEENDYDSNEANNDFSIEFTDENDSGKSNGYPWKKTTTTFRPKSFSGGVSTSTLEATDVICRTGENQSPVALIGKEFA